MNKPVCITQTREQLLQRLSTRRPLYQAIKDNLSKSRALHAELMEPRVLLSADLVAAGAAVDEGLEQVGDLLDQFFDDDLLNADVPLLVLPSDSGEGVDAATLSDLMSLDVNLVNSEGASVYSPELKSALEAADTVNKDGDLGPDGKVSLGEFFDAFFEDELINAYSSGQSDTEQALGNAIAAIDGSALITELAGLGFDLDIEVAAQPGPPAGTDADSDKAFRFELDVSLSVTRDVDVDLGTGFESLGVTFNLDSDLRSQTTTTLDFDLVVGADSVVYAVQDSDPDTDGDQSTPASADFYLELDELNAETVVNPLGLTNTITAEDVQIGFLGVAATGSISLRSGVEFDANVSDNKLRIDDLKSPVVAANFTGKEALANAVSGSFLFSVDEQFFDYVEPLDIALVTVDPFDPLEAVVDGDRFNLAVTVGDGDYLDELSSFNRLDPSSFLTILGKVASAAEGVSDNEAVSGFDIPFTSTTVGDVLDFVGLVQDKLLYSDELGLTDEAVEADPDQADPGERLLDRDGRPTFKTIQELSNELADILGNNTPLTYDKSEKELTLDLSFDQSVTAFEVPLDFNLDLGPLGDISNGSGSLQLGGSAGLGLTLGIDLGAVPTSDLLQPDTPLVGGNTSVDIENQDLAAITGGPISDFTLDSETDLAGTATFTITLAGTVNKNGAHSIVVADLGRTNMTDLIADINDGLNSAGISLYVQAVSNGDGWYDLRLSGPAADGDDTFTVSNANSVAQTGLGLDSTAISGTSDNPRSGPFTKDAPLVATKNSEGGEDITLTISDVDLVVKKVDLGTNSNILLLVNDLNKAIEGTTLNSKVEISSSGRSLIVSTIDPTFTNLTVAENHPLGFYGDGDAIEEASEESSGNLNDFIITTTDGEEYGVSLSAATNIQGVIDAVAAATSNKVTLTIDPDSGDRLVLTQAETVTAVGLNLFSVVPTNGSRAAVQLGIVGVDGTIGKSDDETPVDEVKGADGIITGSIIAGPSLADRVFLEDAQLRGSVGLTASNVSAVGSFGFVDVSLAGDGGIDAGFTVDLKNPDDQSNKFTLAQLQNFFFGETKPTLATVTNAIDPSFTVNGQIDVTLGVATGVPGIDSLAAGLTANPIIVTLESLQPDNAILPSLSVNTNYSGLSNLTIGKFTDIGFSEILDGIILATDFLSGLEEFEFLNEPIPLVNASVTDFLSLADKLDAAVQSSSDNPSGSLQDLESGLKSAFGIAPEDTDSLQLSVIDVPGEGDAIRIDLELDLGFSEYVGIDLDIADAIAAAGLPDLLAGASLAGSAGLAADGSVTLSLAFGVGLTKGELIPNTVDEYDGNLGDVYVFGGKDETTGEYNSGIDGDLSLVGTELNFRGAIGPAGIFVKDGEASAFAKFGAGLKMDYVVGESVIPGLFDIELDADVYAVLPVSFPTEGSAPELVTISAGATQQLELGSEGEFINPEIDLLAGTADVAVDGLDTLLSGFNPADQGLLDNILLVVDGVDLFLSGLQDVLDGEVGGMTLPLVGDSLADGAQFIAEFRENFVDNFREGVQGFADPDEESIVDTLLTDLLAQIFPESKIDENTVLETTNANVPGVAPEDLFIQWDVDFGAEYAVESGIGLDLGLEDLGLALETEGSVGLKIAWALDLGFGLSGSEGAYLDLDGEEELSFLVDVESNAGITGTLFFLQLSALEGAQNIDPTGLSAEFFIDVVSKKWPQNTDPESTETPEPENYRVGFSDLGSLDFEVSVLADALVDLDLTLRIDGADSLPEIRSNFELIWALDDGAGKPIPLSDISGDTLKAGLQNVGFKNVRLDAGSFLDEFLSPVLSEIQEVTGPIEDIVDFITAPLPVISDLGPSISLLDIAEAIAPQQLGFINSIDDLLSVINSIPTDAGGLEIPFGDFAIFDVTKDAVTGLDKDFDLGQLADEKKSVAPTTTAPLSEANNPGSSKGKTAGFIEGLKSNGSLQFPFLSDPSQIFGLLTGDDIDLFKFVLNPLGVEFEYSQFFPIIGPLGASISGSFSAIAKLAFGFDTSGINQFADTGFSDPGLIFNGFYLDDYYGTGSEVPELELDLSLEAAAELNLGVARGGVSGGVYANVQFDLNDPNLDGKVRVEELLGNVIAQAEAEGLAKLLAPLAVFDVSGDVYAQLKAFLEVDLFFFEINYSENITPPITIFKFDIPFTRPVQLATEFTGASGQSVMQSAAPQPAALTVGASAAAPAPTGTVLQLSVGELADLRLNGDVTDGNDGVTITESSGDLTVTVRKDGSLVGTSTYDGIPDTILVRLGDGNDSFDASGVTSDIDFQIYGGSGNDTIILGTGTGAVSYVEGGVGDDLIVGTGGEDILIGEAGNDVIFGQGGADVISGDALEISETATLRADSNDTTDGNDWIAGGTDADIIFGAGGVDTILGDAMWIDVGKSKVLATIRGSAIDDFTERLGADLIIGDGGLVDLAMLTSNPDAAVSLTSTGAGSGDTIRAGGFADRVYGGKGDDNIRGGGGDDTIRGEEGSHTIRGGSGDDIIYGGEQSDILVGDDGNDWIYGKAGADLIEGNAGDDSLLGGFGNDLIFGDEGDDRIRGGGDADVLYGDTGINYRDADGKVRVRMGSDGTFVDGQNRDYLDGEYGNDLLYGEADGDQLISSFGNDVLDGGFGQVADDNDPIGAANTVEGITDKGDFFKVAVSGGKTDREVQTLGSDGADELIVVGSVKAQYQSDIAGAIGAVIGTETKFDRDLIEPLTSTEFTFNSDSDSEFDLILEDTGNADEFLLRASGTIGFVASINKDETFSASEKDDAYQLAVEAWDLLQTENTQQNQAAFEAARDAYDSASDYAFERINYTGDIEALVVKSGDGEDAFQLDGNLASTTISGGDDIDRFQIGQIYNVPRDGEFIGGNIKPLDDLVGDLYELADNKKVTDVFKTEVTTRGYLSFGIDQQTTISGDDGNDEFVVFRNNAVLTLNGKGGDDSFEVRAFALGESVEKKQSRTDISGGKNADSVLYAVNADVNIDGGEGIDTVAIIGTEFSDDFVITANGIFGSGLSVNYKNVEVLRVDGAEGDDRFFIQSTGEGVVTEVVGGLGSDSFNVAGDAPPVVSKDLKGHSGKISHTIVTADDSNYAEVRVRDVVANVGDSDSPGIVVIPQSESGLLVVDNEIPGLTTASYALVLTRPPANDEKLVVTISAPEDDSEKPLVTFTDTVSADDSKLDADKVTVTFDSGNWNTPQTVSFEAAADVENQSGYLIHDVKLVSTESGLEKSELLTVTGVSNSLTTADVVWDDPEAAPDNSGAYRGGSFTVLGATETDLDGETRKIESYDDDEGTFELASSWNVVPNDGKFKVVLTDGTELTGKFTNALNNTKLTIEGGPTGENGKGPLRGATLTYVSNDGLVTESRLIVSNTATELVLDKPWESEPTTGGTFSVELYSTVRLPSIEVFVNQGAVGPTPGSIAEPGVRIIETQGSTDVLEPFGSANSGEAYSDSYVLELTETPEQDVTVYIQPQPTLTTRGLISSNAVQVDVVPGDDVLVEENATWVDDNGDTQNGDRYYVLFEAGTTNLEKTVNVKATADTEFDGGDKKFLPTIPRTVGGIDGPLILVGAGDSERSLGSLSNPLLLPGENNTLPKIGDIVDISNSTNGSDTVTVPASIINALISEAQLDLISPKDLIGYTFTVASGPGQGQQLIIKDAPGVKDESEGATYEFTFDADYQWDDNDLPDETSGFLIDQTNPNLLVDEEDQVDIVTVFNNEAVADQKGELTADTLTGFGMGGDITYDQMENFTLNLGKGVDTLSVTGTHTSSSLSPPAVTLVNAGRGDDVITVNLEEGVDGFFAVKGEEGDDTVDAAGSSLGVIAFGDEGSDTLIGGSGADLLLGDIGRVDYVDEDGKVITRLGLEHDFETMDRLVTSEDKFSGRVPDDQTAPRFSLDGLPSTIVSLDRNTIDVDLPRNALANDIDYAGATIKIVYANGDEQQRIIEKFDGTSFEVAEAWETPPDNRCNYVITTLNGETFEGDVTRAANNTNDGEDILRGNGGSDILIGGAADDRIDGGANSDLILGDNAQLIRVEGGGSLSELEQTLENGPRLYDEDGNANASTGVNQINNSPFDLLDLILLNHEAGQNPDYYGHDYIAGGAGGDLIFGQKGDDTVQGDSGVSDEATESNPDVGASVSDDESLGKPVVSESTDDDTDGNDYIEGNDGEDTIFGNLGQDTLIGGSSNLFGLDEASQRKDKSDLIFGGSGNQLERDNEAVGKYTEDADFIFGDNARVVWLPAENYKFDDQYQDEGEGKIVVRAYTLLDYTPGTAGGQGAADELHGEGGNDTIHGMIGNDVLFGEGQDDNIIGGVGYDRIYGGSGVDGILGDDGLIQVSRNGTAEPLSGVTQATNEQVIRTKGKFVGAVVNPDGDIHKAAELQAWEDGDNDVIYGGLGDDFIHGGSGDDAISGAEALEIHYHSQSQDQATIVGGSYSYDPSNPLQYDEDSRKLLEFVAEDPRPLIEDFFLNFNAADADGKIEDGIDRIFGDMGNDWIVGGTEADRMFGGLGDDLINADDNLETIKTDADEYGDGDFAYGGGGLDVLIANTGRDRLFDWNGEFNSFYVPFSRFGAPTVNRKISPDTVEFLEQLGEFSGADMTLGGDSSLFDELGLVDNGDELSKDQKGSPRDPQPGNMKGKYDDAGEPEELNLLAAELPQEYSTEVVIIDDLRAVGQAAVERWLASGELNDAQLIQLSGMVLQIADLGGLKLAQASNDGKTIYIDSNAAGYGWFVDSTAMQDEEFVAGKSGIDGASTKMDLLSVVMHEIGHQLGLGHGDSGVMHESLDAGVRSAGLLAEGSVYTFDDDSGLAATANDEHDHGWVEVATDSMATDHLSEQSAQVDWNDSF